MGKQNWIIVNAGRGGRFECLRCGGFHMPSFPIEVWAMTALMRGFNEEHADCEEGPDGLHCIYCGDTGHEPEACERLDAKTPEQWLSGPDTGTSSLTIYDVLYRRGVTKYKTAPRDPSDFGRCYRLIALFPAWRSRLGEVAARYPEWAPLVAHWDELTALYEEELPQKSAPKLYALMKRLRGEQP